MFRALTLGCQLTEDAGLEVRVVGRHIDTLPGQFLQPGDLAEKPTAMPANPDVYANLYPVDPALVLHLIGVKHRRDFAAIEDVDQPHPLASMHSRNRWRARWISTPI